MAPAPYPPEHWSQVPNAPQPGTWLGKMSDLADGQATMATIEAQPPSLAGQGFKVLLLRSGESVFAYVNRCAHFGVPLAAKQEHLIFVPHRSITCNAHYFRYRWSDGVCESSECTGEKLLAIPVDLDAQGGIRIAGP